MVKRALVCFLFKPLEKGDILVRQGIFEYVMFKDKCIVRF